MVAYCIYNATYSVLCTLYTIHTTQYTVYTQFTVPVYCVVYSRGRQPITRGPNMTLFKKMMGLFNFRENFDCLLKSIVLGVGVKGVRRVKFF